MEWHCFRDYSRLEEVDIQLEDLKDHHKFTRKGMKCPKCGITYETLDWYCYKDKVKMEEADIKLVYQPEPAHKLEATQKGLKCPVCGISFFLEYFTLSRLASAEAVFETK